MVINKNKETPKYNTESDKIVAKGNRFKRSNDEQGLFEEESRIIRRYLEDCGFSWRDELSFSDNVINIFESNNEKLKATRDELDKISAEKWIVQRFIVERDMARNKTVELQNEHKVLLKRINELQEALQEARLKMRNLEEHLAELEIEAKQHRLHTQNLEEERKLLRWQIAQLEEAAKKTRVT